MSAASSRPTLSSLADAATRRGLVAEIAGNGDTPIGGVCHDSRQVRPGDLFVALPGTRVDGAAFVAEALARGAAAVVCDPAHRPAVAPALLAADVATAAGLLASAFHGDPSDALDLVGITGTNGKTSCTYLLESVWKAAGTSAGIVGTIVQRSAAFERTSAMTTPSAVELQALLAEMRAAGTQAVAIEVSSHALDQRRVAGCRFTAAVFTNLTRDHLDYHDSEDSYFAAKASLFRLYLDRSRGAAILNADDARVFSLAAELSPFDVWTYSTEPRSRARARVVAAELSLAGTAATFELDGKPVEVRSRLVGTANLSNLVAAAAAAKALGVDAAAIAAGLSACAPVPGRMERVSPAAPAVFVDYAHTPDALARSLAALRPETRGRLIVVFGCGGDRDRGKRPIMGRIAAEAADVVLVTSDNPRSEEPEAIVAEIEQGIVAAGTATEQVEAAALVDASVRGYLCEPDRLLAIETAIAVAEPDDVVLVAGKGHENYQEARGERRPFDDRLLAASALVRRAAAAAPPLLGRLGAAAEAMGASLDGDASATYRAVSTDSRSVAAGELFFCLRGPSFDGHDFAARAARAGAVAVVAERGRLRPRDLAPAALVQVDDPLTALGDLAAAHRLSFAGSLVAVTGSNGKTTTKEMLRAIFAAAYGEEHVLATKGNLNNLIGVPLTLFGLAPIHRVAVVEMGMNVPGEIARLVEIARPTIGLITCVAEAHLEGLGSIEGVADAKGELFEGLPENAVAIVNAGDPHVEAQSKRFSGERLGFGPGAEVTASDIEAAGVERISFTLRRGDLAARVELPVGGRHNVANALGAAAAALAAGVALERVASGLSAMKPPPMRMAVETLANGVVLVDDAYNANPGSLAAALDTLAGAGGGRLVVVGDMLELGPRAAELHRRVGAQAAAVSPKLVCAYGRFAADVCEGAVAAGLAPERARVCARHEDAAAAVAGSWLPGDSVLVKGSRGSAMENVSKALRALAGEARDG